MQPIKYTHEALTSYNEDLPEGEKPVREELTLKGEYAVCPNCRGEGHHFRRDLDENAMLDDMRQEPDFDEQFDNYRSGAFDEVCVECKGNRVIPEVDEYFEKHYPREYQIVQNWEQGMADHEAECRAERAYHEAFASRYP